MTSRSRLLAFGVVPLLALAAGCRVAVSPDPNYPPPAEPAVQVSADATVYPTAPPPDPIPEYRPPAPSWDYAWINGYWDWTGYDWTWYSGYWVPQREFGFYVAPRFVFMDGRPVYYRSYWQGPGGRPVYGYGYRGSAPPAAWRARPEHEPAAWRAQHNEGWRGQPGAAAWHGAPPNERRVEERRGEERRVEERRGEERRMEDHRAVEEHRADERRMEPGHPGGPAGPGPRPGMGEPPHAGPPAGAPARRPPPSAPPPHGGGKKK